MKTETWVRSGDLSLEYDPERSCLVLLRGADRLPWEIDATRTAGLTVRAAPSAADQEFALDLTGLERRRLSESHLQFIGEPGGAGVALDVEAVEGGFAFRVSPLGTGPAQIVGARWPGEVRLRGASREVSWSNYHQGALFRSDGRPWDEGVNWAGAVARFYGLSSAKEALATIVETPYDAEAAFTDDGRDTMTASLRWMPSLGSLAYPRSVRFLPLRDAGYAGVAQAFRLYAQDHGLWKSWDERVEENPEVAKLVGAFVACAGYWHDAQADQVGAMRALRSYGFDRGYLFSPKLFTFGGNWAAFLDAAPNRMTDDQIRAIQDLGYVCAPFLQVEESDESIGPEKFAVDAAGQRIKRWQINENCFYEITKWRVPSMLPVFDAALASSLGVHFDTLNAMGYVEHAGERSYDRAGDARLRNDLALYYRGRRKIVVAECLRDASVQFCDMGTAKSFCPVYPDRRVWSVPLTDLVYHDSVIRTVWEHHPYDDNRCVHSLHERSFHPWGQYLLDLLTASPPVLFPEGMLYEYEHRQVTQADGRPELEIIWSKAHLYRKRYHDPETQAALPLALRVCRLNRRHGVARMTAHRFIDPSSPFLQETEFATGLHVVANYGDEPFTLPGGRTVGARSAVVDGET